MPQTLDSAASGSIHDKAASWERACSRTKCSPYGQETEKESKVGAGGKIPSS